MEVFVARVGLVARGIVYMLMGFLSLLVARGAHAEVDQRSVLQQVLLQQEGRLLVGLLAIGFGCYALWRFIEALGAKRRDRTVGARVVSLVRGAIYASFAYAAVSVFNGSRQHQSSQQRRYALDVMSRSGGRLIVGLLGFAIVVVGVVAINEGLKFKFMRYFQGQNLSPAVRLWIRDLGRVGTMARGFVFSITGILIISAAWTHNAAKATGLDGALKTLRDEPFGGLLLGVVATGLIIFGVYGLAEARYRRI